MLPAALQGRPQGTNEHTWPNLFLQEERKEGQPKRAIFATHVCCPYSYFCTTVLATRDKFLGHIVPDMASAHTEQLQG